MRWLELSATYISISIYIYIYIYIYIHTHTHTHDAPDKWNRQPLHWAVLNGHAEAVRALLAAGARPEPGAVPARVHRRRTSLVAETPAALALRLHGPGEILDALVAAGAPAPPQAAL